MYVLLMGKLFVDNVWKDIICIKITNASRSLFYVWVTIPLMVNVRHAFLDTTCKKDNAFTLRFLMTTVSDTRVHIVPNVDKGSTCKITCAMQLIEIALNLITKLMFVRSASMGCLSTIANACEFAYLFKFIYISFYEINLLLIDE